MTASDAGSVNAAGGGMSGASSGGFAGAIGGTGGTSSAGAGGSGGAAQPTSPVKILCVGDSITEQEASWIYPLQDALREAGCNYELIGLDQGPYNGPYVGKLGYDSKRVAAGGFSTTGILNYIKEKGMGGAPDVVIEYLGVNNVYGGFIDGKYNPDNRDDPDGSYIKDNQELIALVRAQNPQATFLLMKIENDALPVIDAAIDSLAAAQSTPASPVIAVAVARDVETQDGIHPTADGAKTLAGPIAKALSALLTSRGSCKP